MIPRYARPEAAAIWSPETRYKIWFEIEAHAATAMADLGVIPREAADAIWAKGGDAKFDADRIDEIERVTKHDVIAFLTHVAEIVGEEARFLHQGMTSSDVLDTCLSVQLARAADLLIADIDLVLAALKRRAFEHKLTPTLGRSHGIHAEPTTFGLKLLNWYAETQRNIERFHAAAEGLRVGKLSGAVGTFGHLKPEHEERICAKLGLEPAPVATQVIQRDRHAHYISTLAIVTSTLDKIATEVRHLQRTEVREAEEFFSEKQKGSSAMPHKRNPITSEQISGLARVVRANAQAAYENIALWHERDISHSSVERIIFPDSTILTDYLLEKTANLIENLLVYPARMLKNLESTGGLIFSGQLLLDLAESGLAREEAYKLVQTHAMRAWREDLVFRELVAGDPAITSRLTPEKLAHSFDMSRQLGNVDAIFTRVLKS
jgi:adenylosuccinate lyase